MRPSLHANSRIPLDPQARIDWADREIGFAAVMAECFGVDEELRRLSYRAWEIRTEAKDELMSERNKL